MADDTPTLSEVFCAGGLILAAFGGLLIIGEIVLRSSNIVGGVFLLCLGGAMLYWGARNVVS